MPENKKQHYVPKFILRNFACDVDLKQINILNIQRRKVILRASLKDQCYRDYFYGKSLEAEKALGALEGQFAKLVRSIARLNTIQHLGRMDIAYMIALQRGRTLTVERQFNEQSEKIARLALHGRVSEDALRKVRITVKNAASMLVAQTLLHAPVIFDLEQLLLVNRSVTPFVISDNPVVTTNWFGRMRLKNRGALIGLGNAGLQIYMPLSPTHALLLHDSGVYYTEDDSSAIELAKSSDIMKLNVLQWSNAEKNIYFPPSLKESQLDEIMNVARESSASNFQRFDYVDSERMYRITGKDEFAPPTEGVTREVVQISSNYLPLDIRVRGIGIRSKPRIEDGRSAAHPVRDSAWLKIIDDYCDSYDSSNGKARDVLEFAVRHPNFPRVGPWLDRYVGTAKQKN